MQEIPDIGEESGQSNSQMNPLFNDSGDSDMSDESDEDTEDVQSTKKRKLGFAHLTKKPLI